MGLLYIMLSALFKLEMEMTISIIFSFCLFLIFLALYFYLLFNLQGRRNLGMIHLIFLEVTTCVKTLRIWAVKTCFELTSMCVSPLYILKYLLTVYFCSARSIYDYGWLLFLLIFNFSIITGTFNMITQKTNSAVDSIGINERLLNT